MRRGRGVSGEHGDREVSGLCFPVPRLPLPVGDPPGPQGAPGRLGGDPGFLPPSRGSASFLGAGSAQGQGTACAELPGCCAAPGRGLRARGLSFPRWKSRACVGTAEALPAREPLGFAEGSRGGPEGLPSPPLPTPPLPPCAPFPPFPARAPPPARCARLCSAPRRGLRGWRLRVSGQRRGRGSQPDPFLLMGGQGSLVFPQQGPHP